MIACSSSFARGRRPTGEAGRVWWWAARLLLLVLVFDLLSAPFHNHHHDDFAIGHDVAATHLGLSNVDHHAHGDDDSAWSHSTQFIRVEARKFVPLLSLVTDATPWGALTSVIDTTASHEVRLLYLSHRYRSREYVSLNISLPPESRAPPLHT